MTSIDLESSVTVEMAARFAALGDPIRLGVVDLLGGGQRCVCELQERLAVAPNLLSYHLRVLREAGVVEASRRGRWVDYRLNHEALGELRSTLGGTP